MRVKKLASLVGALAAVGAMAVVVGMFAFPAAGQTEDRPDARRETKDGRIVGRDERVVNSAPVKPGPETFPKTYYVGDLIGIKLPVPNDSGGPIFELRPVIDLVTSTVARGSWNIQDGVGHDISSQFEGGDRSGPNAAGKPFGTIVPFYVSISLIVRCKAEVHDEVAALLRRLRRLQDTRENPGVDLDAEEQKLGLPPHSFAPKPAVRQPSSGQADAAPSRDKRARIQQLFDALRQEVEKLSKDLD